MKKTSALTTLMLVALAPAAWLACGGGTPKPADGTATQPSPSADTSSASPTSALAGSASAAPANEAPSPLAQVLVTDSAQVQKIFDAATAARSATLKDNGAAGKDALAKGIRDMSMKLPAGMKAEGPLATGKLTEKQHLQTDITLAPGKCYSIVGFSKTVHDLDLYLLLPPGILSGQDLSDDNKPVIGGPPQPMCPTAPQAVSYKLDIFADSGGGDVAVQLFSKAP